MRDFRIVTIEGLVFLVEAADKDAAILRATNWGFKPAMVEEA